MELTNEAIEFLRAIFDAFDSDGVCQFLFSDIYSDDFFLCKLQMVPCRILLEIGQYFLFLQDGMLRPRELEELFSTAPER